MKNSKPYIEDIQLFSFFRDCPCKYYILRTRREQTEMDFQLSEVLPALEKNAVISSLSEVIQSGVTTLMLIVMAVWRTFLKFELAG
jgi:hypothetical protein